MMKMSPITLPLVVLAIFLGAAAAHAQSEQDSDQSNTSSSQPMGGMQMPGMGANSMSMMGSDMMPSDNMMHGGMMHGGAMCPMMGMMNMMGMPHHGGGMAQEKPIDHIEGRIAYLKAEIKITPDQEDKWKAFAEALRSAAMQKNMMHGRKSAEQSALWQDRLAKHQERLQARLDQLKSVKEAADPLFASMTNDQRQLANELLSGPMGIVR